jgi:hypothetical protein
MEKKSDLKNFYSLVPNYAALRELEEKYYHKPTEEEIRRFLNFWQEIYDFWRQKNTPFELSYVEEKVKVRKSLIDKLGIRD